MVAPEQHTHSCQCTALGQSAVVDFGSNHPEPDLPGLVRVRNRGLPYWWLYESRCSSCGIYWLVAQEERFNEVYLLRRLSESEARAIDSGCGWPGDFDRYEDLLQIGAKAGHRASFLDPREQTLQAIAADMLRDRPHITASEISDLVNVCEQDGAWLLQTAKVKLGDQHRAAGI